MNKILFGLAAFFLTVQVQAQFICSTPQEPILERTDANKKAMIPLQRGVQKYIPVTFHLVAAANGTGRVTEENVLLQLCNLNAQYADQEALFYIDRFNYFDNDAVFQTPASSAARVQMRLRKDNNSVNLFITNTADNGQSPGFVLAYYDPQDDWIVSRKNEINGASSTIAHEMGHFFSLAHPHAGWDCYPFTLDDYTNPINRDFTLPCDGGGGSLLIELNNRSNCNTAGDRICDTPEDYNLGLFYQNNCGPNTSIMDKNGAVITPMENNFMGYYRDCAEYAFTQTQKNLINTDFFSIQRAYIRTGNIPNTTPVTGPVSYVSPINGQETPGATNVRLDWEDTPGANRYLVIIDRFPSFTFNPEKFIVDESEVTLDELTANVQYYWKVWPYNESQTCAGYSATQNFRVGTGTAVNAIREVETFALSPNPANGLDEVRLTVSARADFAGDLVLVNTAGSIVYRSRVQVPAGMSAHPIPVADLSAGVYMVRLETASGRLADKLLVAK